MKERPKSFQSLPLEVPSYVMVKWKNMEGPSSVELSMHQDEIWHSHIIDTLQIIARSQANKSNLEQEIPGWTDFNELMCDSDSDD